MPAIESIGYTVTAPGTTLTDATTFPGDVNTIRGAPGLPGAWPLALTTFGNASGIAALRRTSGNDLVRGYYTQHLGATPLTIAPIPGRTPSPPGELVRISLSGTATGGQTENAVLTLYYPEAPSGDAELLTHEELLARAREEVTIHFASVPASAASWAAETPLTSQSDLLRADRRYAWLGVTVSTDIIAVAIRGPSTANLRIACPASTTRSTDCTTYFLDLANRTKLPTIPVIRGSDRAAYVLSAANRAASTPNITLHLVSLA